MLSGHSTDFVRDWLGRLSRTADLHRGVTMVLSIRQREYMLLPQKWKQGMKATLKRCVKTTRLITSKRDGSSVGIGTICRQS